jgi:hypothetical protein
MSSHKLIQVAEPETGHNYIRKAEYSGRNKNFRYKENTRLALLKLMPENESD